MSAKVVHIPPLRETHDNRVGMSVIRGRDVENHEALLYRLHTSGYAITDVPDDGLHHTFWTGGRGSKPCHACNSGQTDNAGS